MQMFFNICVDVYDIIVECVEKALQGKLPSFGSAEDVSPVNVITLAFNYGLDHKQTMFHNHARLENPAKQEPKEEKIIDEDDIQISQF